MLARDHVLAYARLRRKFERFRFADKETRIHPTSLEKTKGRDERQNCVSIFHPPTTIFVYLHPSRRSLARVFSLSLTTPSLPLSPSLSLSVDPPASRSVLLPPSPTSYRRYVGCATSLPGNRYLAGFTLNGARYTVVPHTRISFSAFSTSFSSFFSSICSSCASSSSSSSTSLLRYFAIERSSYARMSLFSSSSSSRFRVND